MRLIDADEFKKQIAGMAIINGYSAEKANRLCELIDCQPTAYDVDKVVDRLEELDLEGIEMLEDGKYHTIQAEEIIDIVREGIKEND